MHPDDLERLVDQALRRLPVPRAPHTLLPRVLAAAGRLSARPWYAREWLAWPRGWQMASLAALMLLLAGVVWLLPYAHAVAGGVSAAFADRVFGDVATGAQRAEAMLLAARILWRALLEPIVIYVFAIMVLVCVACAAFGAALSRIAVGRA
jgi:hypothetical protein